MWGQVCSAGAGGVTDRAFIVAFGAVAVSVAGCTGAIHSTLALLVMPGRTTSVRLGVSFFVLCRASRRGEYSTRAILYDVLYVLLFREHRTRIGVHVSW